VVILAGLSLFLFAQVFGWLYYAQALGGGRYKAALVSAALVCGLHFGVAGIFFQSALHANVPSILALATAPLPAAAVLVALYLRRCKSPPTGAGAFLLVLLPPFGAAALAGAAIFLHLRPLTVLAEAPVELAAGPLHACGLLPSGRLVCAGANWDGQLGASSRDMRDSFVSVTGISDAQHVYVGDSYTCVLRSGGRVTCFGGGETFKPRAKDGQPWDVPGSEGTVMLSTEDHFLYGVRADGAVYGWPTPPPDEAQGALVVRTRHDQACAVLRNRGHVICWTREYSGAIAHISHAPDIEDAVDAAPEKGGGCAVRKDGSVRCWKLASPHPREPARFRTPALSEVREVIAVGHDHYVFGKQDGAVVYMADEALRAFPELSFTTYLWRFGNYFCARRRNAAPRCDSLNSGAPDRIAPFERSPSTARGL
jgi:hypothetical protein